ncbi:MAG: hypothetical protein ACXWUX_13005 [Allosphingosinicella sp.]
MIGLLLLAVASLAPAGVSSECRLDAVIAPLAVICLTGSSESVDAYIASSREPQIRWSEQIVFIGRDRLPDGRERLRYQMPRELPYRDVGALVYLAQRHGLNIGAEGMTTR